MRPTFTTRSDIPIVGLAQPFRKSEGVDGPAVWRRFRPFADRIPNRVGSHTLGLNEVVDMEAGELIYAPAVEVSAIGDLPDELFGPGKLFSRVLEGGRFAVFAFPLAGGDIGADFRRAYDFIYGEWAQQKWRLPARPVRFRTLRRALRPGDAERRGRNLGAGGIAPRCVPFDKLRAGSRYAPD